MNRVKEILKSTNLEEEEINFFADNSRPTLVLELNEKEDYSVVANCRIGGWPDLPVDYMYPKYGDELYVFIAQLDLSQISSRLDINLPSKGMLYFFLESDEDPQNVKHLIWYSNELKKNLRRFKPSTEFKLSNNYESEFPSYKIDFQEHASIDSNKFSEHYSSEIESNEDLEKLIYSPSRIGGYSQSTGGEVEGNIIWEKGELGKHERALIARGYPLNS